VFEQVEVDGRPGQNVVVVEGTIVFVGGHIDEARAALGLRRLDAAVVDGGGGALLPGLHDHHLHLFSLAAQDRSVCCGAPEVSDRDALGRALRSAAAGRGPGEWVRGYGYDETVVGRLDATTLDELLGDFADRPVRVQHRSGHQWVLNAAGIATVGVAGGQSSSPADGTFSDLDGALRRYWAVQEAPSLAGVGARLAASGVTGVTDATVSNSAIELSLVAGEQESGTLPQRVLMLGGPMPARSDPLLRTGARKIVLVETELPSLDELTETIRDAGDRGVAVHCVSREALVLAAVALKVAGGGPHRIEHASVAPPEVVALLRTLPVTVVTQPGFVSEHGDRYLREVDPIDRPWLYRLRAWVVAGVSLAGSTDGPFGGPDPWAAMGAAVSRRTADGARLGTAEGLSPEEALRLFLAPLEDPGGPDRKVAVGARADLCLLSVPWLEARCRLDRRLVRATYVGGREIWPD
jgi:predicted amidohydrolase YtcJ